jgi:hypothetical protein
MNKVSTSGMRADSEGFTPTTVGPCSGDIARPSSDLNPVARRRVFFTLSQ